MRTPSEWKVEMVSPLGLSLSSWPTRSCISFAALLVKVMAAMFDG
jgi:hypothetical protein